MLVYGLARRFGASFFETRPGRMILHPRQLAGVSQFYDRWGVIAIFASRFLPGFRAVVPIFAGVSGVGAVRTGLPVFVASGLWYGFLVVLGNEAGRNWSAIEGVFSRYTSVLAWIAIPLAILLMAWWWRSRRRHHRQDR